MAWKRTIALCIVGMMATHAWAAPNQLVRLCVGDKASFYFYNSIGTEKSALPGLVFDLIEYLQKKLPVEIRVIRRPRHACNILLEKGEVDALTLLSFSSERERFGLFPMKAGQPDPDRAVIRTSYFLYYRQDQALTWDGKSLDGLKGKRIGAFDGVSIVADLEQAGVNVQTFKSLDGMITRLQKGDIDAVAVNDDKVARASQKLALQKHDKPLKTKDYFLLVSRIFRDKYPTLPDQIWKESAAFLKSPEGAAALAKYEKLESFP